MEEVTHCQIESFQVEGEVEVAILQRLEEEEVEEVVLRLLRAVIEHLQYLVRATTATKLADFVVQMNHQFSWS